MGEKKKKEFSQSKDEKKKQTRSLRKVETELREI